ncbi:MAG: FAD:protein FMN transferase [Candidatus Aminicenantes bacterium]|nr:FAD:protein FMN transferase [Candidatus Aminicenantes bacterium]
MKNPKPFVVSLGLFLSAILLSPACRRPEKWRSSTLLFFDTLCEVKIFCSPRAEQNALEHLQNLFTKIERLFSPDSQERDHPLVKELFLRALEVYRASDGCFDISVAPLSRLWGFRDHSHKIPPPQKVQEALRHVGLDKAALKNGHLKLPEKMELDWGGIAKGYGIDLAVRALQDLGIEHGFLNAGGDLFCWGNNPENQSWKIGIKHPRKGGIIGMVPLRNTAAATTGDYQRFFIQDGTRYHHVFDPKTGYPSRGWQSITVFGPETLICDALSTALFVSRDQEGLLQKYPQYGAVLVDEKGDISLLGKIFPFKSVS